MPWWSFTKTVLAAASLVLVGQGRLTLDAPIEGRPFTLRQLLQHRSGLRDYGGLAAYQAAVAAGETPWPVTALLERAEARRLLFKPGMGWAYSNIGYLLVRRMIEQKCNAELDTVLRELVLAPLGLVDTYIAKQPDALEASAWGNTQRYDPGWVYHGLLIGPASDAALLLHLLLAGHLLAPSMLDAMRTAWPVGGPLSGRPWLSYSYGLGLTDCRTASGRFLGHTGGGPGSTSAVYRRVAQNGDGDGSRTVAVFAPSEDPALVENQAMAGPPLRFVERGSTDRA